MPWPTPQDYNEAIQNPSFAFRDPELQTGSCDVTALGLPKPITGNFASVYRVRCSGRDWAVRCFWRELADMQVRYQAISAHLALARLPYTVGFEYQPEGIRVRGQWYPILKMEWVEGELLNDYLVSHLTEAGTLHMLMERWMRMVGDLERSRCAHGDLQHGNVLVVNHELRLVDYDGMFVPALAGRGSHELGQQHYQHPLRGADDFGPYLDRFSSWVIYLSIAALQVDPSLWALTRAGDERLLLQRRDFEDPSSSHALSLLADHPNADLQTLTQKFRSILNQPVRAVPALATAVPRAEPGPLEGDDFRSATPGLFLRICRRMAPAVPAPAPPIAADGSHPSWVIDHLASEHHSSVAWTNGQVDACRLVTLGGLPLAGVAGIGLLAVGLSAPAAVVASVLVWLVIAGVGCVGVYRRLPAVQSVLPLVQRESLARSGIARCARERRRIESRLERVAQRNARDRAEAERQLASLHSREAADLQELQSRASHALESCDRRKREIDRREQEEIERALAELQTQHIAAALRGAGLRQAPLPRIGWTTKVQLFTQGVWAAADVSSERIRTIRTLDHDQLMEVIAWRVDTETAARRSMPRHVPAARRQALQRQYERARLDLDAARRRDEGTSREEIEQLQTSFAARRRRVAERLEDRIDDRMRSSDSLEAKLAQLQQREDEHRESLCQVRRVLRHPPEMRFSTFLWAVWVPDKYRSGA